MKKIGTIPLFIILLTFFLTACGVKYNAVLYDSVQSEIQEKILKNNLTQGAYYGDDFRADESYPKFISYIVKDREELSEIFIEAPAEIDFEKETLVLYFFTCHYMGRSYKLTRTSVSDRILKIEIESARARGCFVGDASRPMQRCFAVKTEKLDITEAEFSVKD